MNRRRLLGLGIAALALPKTALATPETVPSYTVRSFFGQAEQVRDYSADILRLREEAIKAAAGTMRLAMRHSRKKEAIDVMLMVDNQIDPEAHAVCNHFFRDWRQGQARPIDTELLLTLSLVQEQIGAELKLNSGYRTPATNALLRRQGLHPARNSLHLLGRAGDIACDGVSPREIVQVAHKLHDGGIGTYGTFVHLDTGPKRSWRG